MGLRNIYTGHYKFGFIFRNWSTNVKKLGKGVPTSCGGPIIRLGGGWGVTLILSDHIKGKIETMWFLFSAFKMKDLGEVDIILGIRVMH